ncbi:HAD family hydrolase [Natronosalvus vescus]|uniref:HAD family hydrolase n=1 Tax=Natronosalvus vescus TaxID=2953881 RepID=UPI00209148C8|nr:HAD family hydrolase [Natronosalvus vescus]
MTTPVVAFDNSGTLSETTVVRKTVVPGYDWLESVPATPSNQGEFALVNLVCDDLEPFQSTDPLGSVLDAADVPIRLALSNCEMTVDRARELLFEERDLPARVVADQVELAVERTMDRETSHLKTNTPPAGAQLVADVGERTVVRVVGYTATPLQVSPEVVAWASENGYDPHIVSGDSTNILQSVADVVGIPAENVHPYQSAVDKRRTVESLGEDRPVVMVGDFVNDRFAFEVADFAVFIDDGDARTSERLQPLADVTVDSLAAVPDALRINRSAIVDGGVDL